jgi:general secretion pathway protein D
MSDAMRRLWWIRTVAAVVLAVMLGAGCAAKWAYRQGKEAASQGEWDLAVARYTRALEKDPDNIGYKIALENARVQASGYHYDEAKKHIAAKELEKAADELQIATNYDPSNRSAADDLLLVREEIRRRDEEQRRRDQYDEMKARAEAARVPVPVLSPRSPVPITMKFQDASLQKIFDSLARIVGVNILFDEGFRDKKYSVNLTGVTFEEALDQLTFVNRLFYKVLDQNTIIIVPESRQKRVAYNELVLRTFYLQNAEVNDTVNLIKTLAKITTAAGNPSLRAITVLGTIDQVAMAERIIELNDKARGEVIVEVKILEVNKTHMKEWGLDLSNYSAAMTLAPTGAEGEVTEDGFTNIRAHVLSSLNRADWVVTLPSTIFARFLQTDSTVRLLSAPRLRAAEGKKAELKVGTEVPVPVTTFSAATSGVSTFAPATSFQYRNVGVNLVVTPEVSGSGDITLEVVAEFSLLGEDRAVTGGGENAQTAPTFLTRNVTNVIRLRDGETGLIGGLIESSQASSVSGALGVASIPVIGKLFGDNTKRAEEREVIISLTPRIVRAPKVTEADLVPLPVGTQAVPKVSGAGPGLFGPEPEAAPEAGPEPEPAPPAGAAAKTPPEPGAAPQPTKSTPPPSGPSGVPAEPAPAPASPPPAASPAGAAAAPTPPETAPDARPVNVLFSPPELAMRVGQTASVAVVLVGARELESVDLELTWDGDLAEITEANPGSLLTLDGTPVAAARTLEAGRARVRFSRSTSASGSGAVVSLTFKGLREGSGPLTVARVSIGAGGATAAPAPPPPGRIVVAP